jgi:hypothetical protein
VWTETIRLRYRKTPALASSTVWSAVCNLLPGATFPSKRVPSITGRPILPWHENRLGVCSKCALCPWLAGNNNTLRGVAAVVRKNSRHYCLFGAISKKISRTLRCCCSRTRPRWAWCSIGWKPLPALFYLRSIHMCLSIVGPSGLFMPWKAAMVLTTKDFFLGVGGRWPVLRTHDILGWIRIRIWIRWSMPLTTHGNESGSGCGSFYFRHWADANKKLIF